MEDQQAAYQPWYQRVIPRSGARLAWKIQLGAAQHSAVQRHENED
jgi:hypothetical protein